MSNKSNIKTTTNKTSVKKGEEKNSTLKVESKIDAKVEKDAAKKVDVKVVKSEVKKKEEKRAPKVESKLGKPEVITEKTVKSKSDANKSTAKVNTKDKTKAPAKAKQTEKTLNKKVSKIVEKEVEQINYLDHLGEAAIKVVISKEKKKGSSYPIKVALKNFGFLKTVKVKYTEDNWNTFLEKDLEFKSQDDNNIEEWSTILELSSKEQANFEYVVSYEVNELSFWDNNEGNNYLF